MIALTSPLSGAGNDKNRRRTRSDNPWKTGDAWGFPFEEARNAIACRRGDDPKSRLADKNFLLGRATIAAGQSELLTRSNLRELEQVVKYTSQLPGQRNVIFVSPGFLLEERPVSIRAGHRSGVAFTGGHQFAQPKRAAQSGARWTHPCHTFHGAGGVSVELCIAWTKTGRCLQGMYWHRLLKVPAANSFTTTTI